MTATDNAETADATSFRQLQDSLADQYRRVFPDRNASRTVVIVPSLSVDQEVLMRVQGFTHYEERMLCLLLLLRMPRTRVVVVTSQPIPPTIIDYYLQLLPGVPRDHALRRLTLLACHDSAPKALTEKILERPRMLRRIREAIATTENAHMTCFNVSELERSLAVRLGIPIYGCDPDLLHIGSKSGSREIFREAGLPLADGFENLEDPDAVIEALCKLKERNPGLRRAVVKLNEGFSGEGNAILRLDDAPTGDGLKGWMRDRLPQLEFAAKGMEWDDFAAKIREMGGIVEEFIEGDGKRTPSAQFRVDPTGGLDTISTHDQVVDEESGQVFLGCRFPADPSYRLAIQELGRKAGEVMAKRGVLGRFAVDFISVPDGDGWQHYAVEINLRKGGTTHPFLMLQFLTDGAYDAETGLYRTLAGTPRHYYASDNLQSERYRGLLPEDLIDIAVENGLHFDGARQEGVVFHMIGALSEFGKLGVVCVAGSPEAAEALYAETVAALDREAGHSGA